MKKTEREAVFNNGGKCAYCGCDLIKGWHVDHLEPIVIDGLTLNTPVYHPIYGKGDIRRIEEGKLLVSFKDANIEFGVTGIVGTDRFLSELYLHPIKIVEA